VLLLLSNRSPDEDDDDEDEDDGPFIGYTDGPPLFDCCPTPPPPPPPLPPARLFESIIGCTILRLAFINLLTTTKIKLINFFKQIDIQKSNLILILTN
jgi:hypothetical protein